MTLLQTEFALPAWQMSAAFWKQTFAAFLSHPGIVLLYATPVALERAWVVLRNRPIPAVSLVWLEACVNLWRLLLCAVAVWIVVTPAEAAYLLKILQSNTLIQATIDSLSLSLGDHVWLLAWEIGFCLAACIVLNLLLSGVARIWVMGQDVEPEEKKNRRVAATAVARNLILVPLALIYVVIVVRQVLS
jgi:hypothetical protein